MEDRFSMQKYLRLSNIWQFVGGLLDKMLILLVIAGIIVSVYCIYFKWKSTLIHSKTENNIF